MLPMAYGLMCRPRTQSSPSRMTAYDSRRLARPSRNDLTSVPVSTMPVSSVSSMKKSWNAFLF